MKIPKEYEAIKRIFNLSLFGIEDAEKNFGKDKKLAFRKEFVSYQDSFLNGDGSEWNALITQSCGVCLPKLKKAERRSMVEVILDNKHVCQTLIFFLMMDEGTFDSEQATANFMISLSFYLHDNKIDEIIILFIQQHFLMFARIDPSNYKNLELDETQYSALIGDYLRIQTNIF